MNRPLLLPLVFSLTLLGLPLFTSAATPSVFYLPAVPQPASPQDIVGLLLQNNTSSALPAHAVSFGETFMPGTVPGTSGITATVDGQTVPAQLDINATNPDGSARFGIVSLLPPAIAANHAAQVMLTKASAPTAAPISLANISNYNLMVTVTVQSVTPVILSSN